MKRIVFLIMLCIVLIQNVNASTLLSETKKDNVIYKIYEVNENENKDFYKNLNENIKIDNKQYKKVNYTITGGNSKETKEIADKKEIIIKSNSIDEILNTLPKNINYDNDNYIGNMTLDYENIKVEEVYNGYYEVYVDETKQYFDLPKNDMSYIPKSIKKDGLTLYLINVDWYAQTKKKTGEIEITDLYRGEAFYRGVKRIDNPLSYKVTANYKGTATKEIVNPYIYTVKYEMSKEKNILTPILIGSTGIFIVVIVLFYRNNKVKLYSKDNKYIGLYKIKNNILDITNSMKKITTNEYIIKFNKKMYRKLENKTIKIVKGTLSKYCKIDNDNIEISI